MFLKPVSLDLDTSVFLDADYGTSSTSCIKHQVYELTDIHQRFGGFPDSYCFENTRIDQLWWTPDEVDYAELGRQLGMEVVSVSSIRQPAGGVIPLHRDMFHQITTRFPDRSDLKVRANIFLEDYRMGQFLQYIDQDEKYVTVTNWQKNTGFMWDSGVLHVTANGGFEYKHTLQVSGFLLD